MTFQSRGPLKEEACIQGKEPSPYIFPVKGSYGTWGRPTARRPSPTAADGRRWPPIAADHHPQKKHASQTVMCVPLANLVEGNDSYSVIF